MALRPFHSPSDAIQFGAQPCARQYSGPRRLLRPKRGRCEHRQAGSRAAPRLNARVLQGKACARRNDDPSRQASSPCHGQRGREHSVPLQCDPQPPRDRHGTGAGVCLSAAGSAISHLPWLCAFALNLIPSYSMSLHGILRGPPIMHPSTST
jgi:hypothetical protein